MTKIPCDEDFHRTCHSILQSLSTNETNLDAVDNQNGVNERNQDASTKIDKSEQLRTESPISNHSDDLAGSNEATSEDDDNEKINQNHTLELPKSRGTTFFDNPAKITKDGRFVYFFIS